MEKNIFLIETDKPTGIFETNSGLQFSIMNKVRYGEFKGFHLYITSDEEIKEGDWCFLDQPLENGFPNHQFVFQNKDDSDYLNMVNHLVKKIILTTDQSLKGVQWIDIEFLEWFVKNPNYEFVVVYNDKSVGYEYDHYSIIIPQEESKTGSLLESTQEVTKDLLREINELKQETLEEIPKELEPILAKISHINDLGLSQWYEVVYYVDDKWCSYSGSKTFEDGERVIDWKYCKEQFKNK